VDVGADQVWPILSNEDHDNAFHAVRCVALPIIYEAVFIKVGMLGSRQQLHSQYCCEAMR